MSQLLTATMNLPSTLFLIFFLFIVTTESADPAYNYCNSNTKTNGNSQISRNINNLLPKLVSTTIQNGFTATSYGQGKDQIFGLAQCRGDVSKADCSSCIHDAASDILKLCPTETDATIWYDFCFLRYNNVNFFGEVDSFGVYLINVQNVTDPDSFNKKLAPLMNQISSQAVKTGSKGLGKGKSDISEFIKLYALVQCTRDLSALSCAQCLATAVGNFPNFCENKRGCRVLYRSCYVRYELYPFFFPLEAHESLDDSSSNSYKSIMAFKT